MLDWWCSSCCVEWRIDVCSSETPVGARLHFFFRPFDWKMDDVEQKIWSVQDATASSSIKQARGAPSSSSLP